MRAWLCLLVAGYSGCSAAPKGETGDVVLDAKRSAAPRAATAARVLWVDFDGLTLTGGASDDAVNDVSQLVSGSAIFPAYDPSLSAPRVAGADAVLAVFGRARWLLRDYDVTLTMTRPASGAYSHVVVGGTPALLGRSSALAGLAPLDCTDANADNIAFAFGGSATPAFGGVVVLGNVVAHEAAHTFGLEHVDDTNDVMFAMDPAVEAQALSQLFQLQFTSSAGYSDYFAGSGPVAEQCGRADPIDDDAILLAALGPSTPGVDTVPPTLNWLDPTPGVDEVANGPVDVEVVASDNFAVDHVEVYRDTELWSVLRGGPPWQTSVDPNPANAYFYLTVEVVDTSGLRTADTRRFDVGLPDAGVVIIGGDDGGIADAAVDAHADAGTFVPPAGGCACDVGGSSPASSWWLAALAIAWCRWRRSARRCRSPSER